jgi:3-oxoacyl-[acyl-carrier protein] reductase
MFILHLLGEKQVEGSTALSGCLNAILGGVFVFCQTIDYGLWAGLLGLTRGLAKEVSPTVYVNAICPGSVDTPMSESLIRSSIAEELKS